MKAYYMNEANGKTNLSRAELIAILDETLTITRTRNGETFTVPSEQYLDESIQHITDLGYFQIIDIPFI